MADSSELQPQAPVPKPRPRRARSGMIASATGPQQQMASAESAERRRGASESGEYIHTTLLHTVRFTDSSTFNGALCHCVDGIYNERLCFIY